MQVEQVIVTAKPQAAAGSSTFFSFLQKRNHIPALADNTFNSRFHLNSGPLPEDEIVTRSSSYNHFYNYSNTI